MLIANQLLSMSIDDSVVVFWFLVGFCNLKRILVKNGADAWFPSAHQLSQCIYQHMTIIIVSFSLCSFTLPSSFFSFFLRFSPDDFDVTCSVLTHSVKVPIHYNSQLGATRVTRHFHIKYQRKSKKNVASQILAVVRGTYAI